jgi:hypothetical protein
VIISRKASRDQFVVTKNGKPVALLLSVTDEAEIERFILVYSPKFQGILQIAEGQISQGEGIYHDDLWREVKAVQEMDEKT